MELHGSKPPKRDYNQIKQALEKSGFDPEISVSIWEQNENGWRWTGKASLVIAICSYEWRQANIGERFPPQFLYETKPEYIFPPNAKVDEEEEEGLAVTVSNGN